MLNPATAVKQLEFAWSGLGISTGSTVDYQAAKAFYQKELRDAKFVQDRVAMTWALASLSHILIRLKNFKEARRHVVESLKLGEALHDYAAMGYVNNLLGDMAYAQGQMEDANLYYHRAWDAYAKIGEKKGEAWSYTNLGNAAQALGDFEAAGKMYEKSIALIKEMDDSKALAWNMNLMGSVDWAIGRYPEALKIYEDALGIYRTTKDVHGEAWTLDLLGNLKLAMKEDEEAELLYRQSRNLVAPEGNDPQGMAWNHYHMGAVYLFRGGVEDAKDEFSKALRFFESLHDNLGQVATLTHLGEIACIQKKNKEAQEHLKRGVELILDGKTHPLLVDILAGVAQLLKSQGEDKKAISLLMVALSNPTCRQQTKDRMVSLAMELETSFTPGEVDKGFRWAKGADLEEMAKGWLVSVEKNSKKKLKPKIKALVVRLKKIKKAVPKAKKKKR